MHNLSVQNISIAGLLAGVIILAGRGVYQMLKQAKVKRIEVHIVVGDHDDTK